MYPPNALGVINLVQCIFAQDLKRVNITGLSLCGYGPWLIVDVIVVSVYFL